MIYLRGFLRLLFLLYFALLLWIEMEWVNFRKGKDRLRDLAIRRRRVPWLIRTLGIVVHAEGSLPPGVGLVVGNHRSYIDPALLMYQHILMPVAKAEVRRWPLIGRAAHASGVVFLERENKNSRKRVLTNIGKTIESGISVLLFPEGTTHRQPKTIDFRPASFNLAAELGIPVFPFALDFADPADYWLDADSFVPHFIRQLGKPRTTAFIHYGPAFTHTEGLELNRMVKNWIDDELGKIRSKINT